MEFLFLYNTRQELDADTTCKPKAGPHFSVYQVDIELGGGVYHKPHPYCNFLTQKFMACSTVNKGISLIPSTRKVKF